jgi:hypothetical protein
MTLGIALASLLFAADAPRADVLVVIGAEGAPEYAPLFAEWSQRWERAAQTGHAVAKVIGREEAATDDRDLLQQALADAAKETERPLWLVLIGHGTFDRKLAKFNLRGPDVSAAEMNDWLKPLTRPVALIDNTASSAPFLNAVAGPKRIVITATKSGSEHNFARFGDFLSQTIADPAADLDKDDQVSLWEAFLAASRRTAEFYQTDGRLLTEHAMLDDTGEGQGSRADEFVGLQPTEAALGRGAALDGAVAHQWHLIPSPAEAALPPEIRTQRDALELEILALRGRKKEMGADEYYAQLEPLLIQLARLTLSRKAEAQQ